MIGCSMICLDVNMNVKAFEVASMLVLDSAKVSSGHQNGIVFVSSTSFVCMFVALSIAAEATSMLLLFIVCNRSLCRDIMWSSCKRTSAFSSHLMWISVAYDCRGNTQSVWGGEWVICSREWEKEREIVMTCMIWNAWKLSASWPMWCMYTLPVSPIIEQSLSNVEPLTTMWGWFSTHTHQTADIAIRTNRQQNFSASKMMTGMCGSADEQQCYEWQTVKHSPCFSPFPMPHIASARSESISVSTSAVATETKHFYIRSLFRHHTFLRRLPSIYFPWVRSLQSSVLSRIFIFLFIVIHNFLFSRCRRLNKYKRALAECSGKSFLSPVVRSRMAKADKNHWRTDGWRISTGRCNSFRILSRTTMEKASACTQCISEQNDKCIPS